MAERAIVLHGYDTAAVVIVVQPNGGDSWHLEARNVPDVPTPPRRVLAQILREAADAYDVEAERAGD